MLTFIHKKASLALFLLIFFSSLKALCLGTAGRNANYESRYIVDMPNAGILTKTHYAIDGQFVSNGGLLLDFVAAPFDFLNLGISYCGYGVIGSNDIVFQGLPGFDVKARIKDEEKLLPAIAIGFNSQGRGLYFKDQKRFEQLSPGIYAVVSKSFLWDLGEISVHAGINYSIEHKNDRGFNMYAGIEQSLGKYISIYLEVNPNFNDDNKTIYPSSSVMLNTAIRASILKSLTIELQLRDLLTNSAYNAQINRSLGIGFVNKF